VKPWQRRFACPPRVDVELPCGGRRAKAANGDVSNRRAGSSVRGPSRARLNACRWATGERVTGPAACFPRRPPSSRAPSSPHQLPAPSLSVAVADHCERATTRTGSFTTLVPSRCHVEWALVPLRPAETRTARRRGGGATADPMVGARREGAAGKLVAARRNRAKRSERALAKGHCACPHCSASSADRAEPTNELALPLQTPAPIAAER
jgi:hypothetical protein